MRVQEKRILIKHLDKIINENSSNPLLLECLYSLGIELSLKNTDEMLKYTRLLGDFRSKVYKDIEPTPIGEFGVFWSKGGYYYFNFKDSDLARRCELVRVMIKDFFNFSWNNYEKAWMSKQTESQFNLEYFTKIITERFDYEMSLAKSKY